VFFYVLFVCKYVLPPGDNTIAVNKYIMFGPKLNEVTREQKNYIMRNSMIRTHQLIFYGRKYQEEGGGIWHLCGRSEIHTVFWCRDQRERRDILEGPGVDGRIILRWIIRNWDVEAWTASNWLRIGIVDGHW
jgi:hypothetical protein